MNKLFDDNEKDIAYLRHKFHGNLYSNDSYQVLLDNAPAESDLVKQAQKVLDEFVGEVDLSIPRQDYWLIRLMMLLNKFHARDFEFSDLIKQTFQAASEDQLLIQDQRDIWTKLNQNPHLFFTLTGQAGSGKSFTTSRLIEHLLNAEAQVLVLAPTHVASTNINQLIDNALASRIDQDTDINKLQIHGDANSLFEEDRKAANITLATLTSWTYRLGLTNQQLAQYGELVDKTLIESLPHYDLIVIDETYAADARALTDVFLFATYTKTPVLLIGDERQLPAINNDPRPLIDWLAESDYLLRSTPLSRIHRAQSDLIVDFSRAILDADLKKLASYYRPINDIDTSAATTDNLGIAEMKSVLSELSTKNLDPQKASAEMLQRIILVPTNAVRRTLSISVQQVLLNKYLIRKTGLTLPSGVVIHDGDVLMIMDTANVHDYSDEKQSKSLFRLRGATRAVVVDTEIKEDAAIEDEQDHFIKIFSQDLGRILRVNVNEFSSSSFNPFSFAPDRHALWRDLDLGYAATVNKVQGLTIDNVIVYIDKMYPHLNQNLLYSGVTRAASSIVLASTPTDLKLILDKRSMSENSENIFMESLWDEVKHDEITVL
ncbi:MAG: AAA family ATPase [Lactobacillaceae bacterium]|jgi:DNA replication protein DnaC|nr:AAA family ATPase [Lactobacillaceae bacterium]